MSIQTLTAYLFAQPSFTEGMARIFDFKGTLDTYNENESPLAADINALSNDWSMVGQDLHKAMEGYERTH